MVLAKEKNDEEARKWLIRSVHQYQFNWGAWQELAGLIDSVEDVSLHFVKLHEGFANQSLPQLNHLLPSLPNHIMSFIFRLYASQELYQSTELVHTQLSELERIFPNSQFLKTQRALLFHHCKGRLLGFIQSGPLEPYLWLSPFT